MWPNLNSLFYLLSCNWKTWKKKKIVKKGRKKRHLPDSCLQTAAKHRESREIMKNIGAFCHITVVFIGCKKECWLKTPIFFSIFTKGPSINYVTWISWFFYPSPFLSQVVTFLRFPPVPSVVSHILQFHLLNSPRLTKFPHVYELAWHRIALSEHWMSLRVYWLSCSMCYVQCF